MIARSLTSKQQTSKIAVQPMAGAKVGTGKKSGVTVRIWGCRGSIPTSGKDVIRYGGDTTCFEVIDPNSRSLVIDCGSGLRRLGAVKMGELDGEKGGSVDVLLTHLHFDHVMGLAMFGPLLADQTSVTLWTTRDVSDVEAALSSLYRPPFWPMDLFQSRSLHVAGLKALSSSMIGSFQVTPFPLNHPGGSTGYILDVAGSRIAVVTDHEHGEPDIDLGIRKHANEADLLIYDAPYSENVYQQRKGWGHSTWENALAMAEDVSAKKLLIVHHAPEATDDYLDAAAKRLKGKSDIIEFARDDQEIQL